jgi:hypothetical protein
MLRVGAGCLPKDEYEKWLKAITPMFKNPTESLFLKWAQQQKSELNDKLDFAVEDHPE